MLDDVLDRIEEYLEQREDADGIPSGGGYRPNEEMQLLTELRGARSKRPEVASRDSVIEECVAILNKRIRNLGEWPVEDVVCGSECRSANIAEVRFLIGELRALKAAQLPQRDGSK